MRRLAELVTCAYRSVPVHLIRERRTVMAEAAVESSVGRFFCHKCAQEISPQMPDFVCPRCQSGFIEELEHHNSSSSQDSPNDDSEDNLTQYPEIFSSFMESLPHLQLLDGNPREPEDGTAYGAQSGLSSQNASRRARPQSSVDRYRARSTVRRRLSTDRNVLPLESVLQQIIANLTGTGGVRGNAGIPIFFNLHGNPGDYVWGRGGLDAVITQLLNQFDGTGPPPLPKEKIGVIPTVNIMQDQVDKILQCTVCMEDFKLGEPVKRLSCSHHFHQDCIIPWLELHGTCPICRKSLNDEENGSDGPWGPSREGPGRGNNYMRQTGNQPPSNSVYDFDEND